MLDIILCLLAACTSEVKINKNETGFISITHWLFHHKRNLNFPRFKIFIKIF